MNEQHRPVRLELYPDTQGELKRYLLVFLEASMALGVAGYTIDLVRKVARDGASQFFGNSWNLIEMVNLVMLVTVVCMRLFFVDLVYGFSGKLPTFARPTPLAYSSMQSLASYEEAERLLLSVSAFVLMFRVFKYHVLFPQISFLLRMLGATTGELRAFMGFLVVLLMGFSQAAFAAFSTDDGSFRTFGHSMLTLFRGMTSGLDVDALLEARPAMGQVFACLFLVTISLVVVNVFIAVLNDGYQDQKMKDELELDEVQVLVGNANADAARQIMEDFLEWGIVPVYRWLKRRIWLLAHAERAALTVSRGLGSAMTDPDAPLVRKRRRVSLQLEAEIARHQLVEHDAQHSKAQHDAEVEKALIEAEEMEGGVQGFNAGLTGTISLRQLEAMLAREGVTDPAANAKDLMAAMDTDGNGVLDRHEIKAVDGLVQRFNQRKAAAAERQEAEEEEERASADERDRILVAVKELESDCVLLSGVIGLEATVNQQMAASAHTIETQRKLLKQLQELLQ